MRQHPVSSLRLSAVGCCYKEPSSSIDAYLSSLLRCCARHSALRPGQQAHAQSLTNALLPAVTLHTDLLLLYSRCSRLDLARSLFDQMPHRNTHSWNILFSAYARHSLPSIALSLLPSFLRSGLRPDHFTLPSLLKSCSSSHTLSSLGELLHNWAIVLGLENHLVVRSSILDMYARFGRLHAARRLFDSMTNRDNVVWNTMISALARDSLWADALRLFRSSVWECTWMMDPMVVPSVLTACGRGGELARGKEVHGRVIRCLLLEYDTAVGNALIDMYSKCGCVDDAGKVFAGMAVRNLVTWSTMMSCYGVNGMGAESLKLYEEMIFQGEWKPNCVTFTSVLSGCSHSGMVDEARAVFESMKSVHGLEPRVEHYACMVDLLGRSGTIGEAFGMIEGMPMEPVASVWGALLGACALHGNVEVGEIAAGKLFELESRNTSNYVALCGIYDAAGMQDSVAKMRARMRELGMVKTPGSSWISVRGSIHAFYQGDVSHPASKRIHRILNGLLKTMAMISE